MQMTTAFSRDEPLSPAVAAPGDPALLPQFLVCGVEHSGTTLMSDLFRQVAGLDSGFEGGVLLCETPADFARAEPFARHMIDGWGITAGDLAHACTAPDFARFYGRLTARAQRIKPDTVAIFDKTPRYLSDLAAVLGRHSAPVILCYRDPRGLVWSDYARARDRGEAGDFAAWYGPYRSAKIAYLRRSYDQFLQLSPDPRVMPVALEHLALAPRAVSEAAFAHVGLAFDLRYLLLPPSRYGQVRGRTVSAEYALAHRAEMAPADARAVLRDFGEFAGWFYD